MNSATERLPSSIYLDLDFQSAQAWAIIIAAIYPMTAIRRMTMPVSAINVRELQGPIKTHYQEDPEAALITLRVKSAPSDLGDPLHCSITPEATPDVTWHSGAHSGV